MRGDSSDKQQPPVPRRRGVPVTFTPAGRREPLKRLDAVTAGIASTIADRNGIDANQVALWVLQVGEDEFLTRIAEVTPAVEDYFEALAEGEDPEEVGHWIDYAREVGKYVDRAEDAFLAAYPHLLAGQSRI